MVAHARHSTLKMYGASDKRRELEPLLIWATPGQRGFPPSTAASASISNRAGSIAQAAPSSLQHRRNVSQTPAQTEAVQKQQEALRKAAELRQMLSSLQKVNDEDRRSSMLDTLCSADDVLNLPLHPSPPSVLSGELKVDLLKHQVCLWFLPVDQANLFIIYQLQALQWCVTRENPVLPTKETDKPVQFWQLKKNGNKVSHSYFILIVLISIFMYPDLLL